MKRREAFMRGIALTHHELVVARNVAELIEDLRPVRESPRPRFVKSSFV
ncbi:MAG: hypothetical protein LC751_05165 [Actinobacteria bacterium]|nr:hypothetical protein [Actinomycetota bacterium]